MSGHKKLDFPKVVEWRQKWRPFNPGMGGLMKFTIEYDDRDTTPERLAAMAQYQGITPEYLIHRAINQYLGGFGLKDLPPDFHAKSLEEFFVTAGAMKPK